MFSLCNFKIECTQRLLLVLNAFLFSWNHQNYSGSQTKYKNTLKENCNVKTSLFYLKSCPKSCKMIPKSSKSAKPFSRYSTLKIEIWTVFRQETTEKPKMLFVCFFFLRFCTNRRTVDCVTSEMINAQLNNKQSRIFSFVDLILT